MMIDKLTWKWTTYLHYTDDEGYPFSEEIDVFGDTYEEALVTASRLAQNGYEPGYEIELVKGEQMRRSEGWWIEA